MSVSDKSNMSDMWRSDFGGRVFSTVRAAAYGNSTAESAGGTSRSEQVARIHREARGSSAFDAKQVYPTSHAQVGPECRQLQLTSAQVPSGRSVRQLARRGGKALRQLGAVTLGSGPPRRRYSACLMRSRHRRVCGERQRRARAGSNDMPECLRFREESRCDRPARAGLPSSW